ncbi:hypothetical protein [Cryobacterium sp. Y11]|uniref:hypothetical protein n=1 Tax=Cryobacterium sp. Y11 TaxID=2045016 RepID=UPI000CE36EE5|nr:hypothetical protein [Cryobacterium sp. Y11]
MPELCNALDRAGLRPTDAWRLVIVQLAGDTALQERIRASVAHRSHAAPGWVLRFDQVRPDRSTELHHVLRDGYKVVIGVLLPGNRDLDIVVDINHNMGTIVKDTCVFGVPLREVL